MILGEAQDHGLVLRPLRLVHGERPRGEQISQLRARVRHLSRGDERGGSRGAAEDDAHAPVSVHRVDGAEVAVEDFLHVVVPLLQHAVGDAEEDIIEAYAASEAALGQRPEDEAASKAQATPSEGVDWSALRGSPPEAMRDTLAWIRAENDGAIDNFLSGVGCGEPWRRTLLQGAPPF